MTRREFHVLVERDGKGGFVGDAVQFTSCGGHGKTLDELMANMRKSIEHSLKDDDLDDDCRFVGFYKIEVNL